MSIIVVRSAIVFLYKTNITFMPCFVAVGCVHCTMCCNFITQL